MEKKKYIDAEKLKQKIESLKKVYNNPNRVIHGVADAFRQDGRVAMCDDLIREIESIQQEHPDYKKLLDSLLEAISYSYAQTDGTYGDLAYVVSDKVKYINNLLRDFALLKNKEREK